MLFSSISFWETLARWDRHLFVLVNSKTANPVFDFLMPWLRNPLAWAPLYLFFAIFALLNFGVKGIWWIVLFLSTVAITDMTGTYLFKHSFERLRPCAGAAANFQVRLLLPVCPGGYSFISNHAANHFGMAAFFIITLRPYLGKWAWLAFVWAAGIGYAQVYVGAHYPADVIAGALLGLAFGFGIGSFFNKRFGFAIFENQLVA